MKLTKKRAIEEHRKMWHCLADKIEKIECTLDVSDFKSVYIDSRFNEYIRNDCFLCEYTEQKSGRIDCKLCPLNWSSRAETYQCETQISIDGKYGDGLWWKCMTAETWQEQAALARQIAELPEVN